MAEFENVDEGKKAMKEACRGGDRNRAAAVISRFPFLVNSPLDDADNYALHHAARFGQAEIIEFLLEEGAPLEPRNKNGQEPLHLAVSNGRSSVCFLLINAGANGFKENEHGKSAVDIAKGMGRKDLEEICEKGLRGSGLGVKRARRRGGGGDALR